MSNEQQLRDAWDAFADNLKTMGHDALASAPNDVERVDGLRFVLRQLAYREEQFLEFPSGHTPELFFAESPTRKVFADCPDTIYHQFSVARGGRYRITGTRGESPYISFTAYRAAVTDRVVADLHDGEIEIAADGTFTLDVGGPAASADWLDLGDDAAFVIIREYTHDRANGVRATFAVEQLSPELEHRPELDAERMTGVLAFLGLGLSWVNDATVKLSAQLRERPNVMNEAGAELVSEMAGTPHNHYQLCYVQLEPHQALELELDPPACRYWSVHLNNWWLESPEYRDGQSVCINDAQAHRAPDGTVKILVGPDDPGTGNWLDTKGRTETILLARYLLPERELPPIVTNIVNI
ncbi:DUF1214 domain-containing protein [Ilumatobacter sp.]|uniref:DUF1214 domain-containing protein n=1 Tax=Ilumatobacter sp. TaxID=1967498 RepID=UPI003AF6A409